MKYLTSLFENMSDVVDTLKCSIYNQKNFKFIAFIIYLALEGKSLYKTDFLIPQEIIITIMSFTFKKRVFFYRPVLMKMQKKQIKPNEKIIIRKIFDHNKYSSINHQNISNIARNDINSFQNDIETQNNKNSPVLYEINIISQWVIKGSYSEDQNKIFKNWKYLLAFLKKVQIQFSHQNCSYNIQKNNKTKNIEDIKCQVFFQDQNLLQHEIQCLKSYGRTKKANSTEIRNILNLIKKNMIIFSLKPYCQNSKQSRIMLLIHDPKRSFQCSSKNDSLFLQNNKSNDTIKNQNFPNKGGLNLHNLPLFFNEEKYQWEISKSYHNFCTTKQINTRKSEFICESGSEYYLNEHDLIEIR